MARLSQMDLAAKAPHLKRYRRLRKREARRIRDQFYAQWIITTGHKITSRKGFNAFVECMEEMLGDWIPAGDNSAYGIISLDEERWISGTGI